jgi:hypothetical protein
MAVIPEKFYVTRVYRSAEEMLGWMVVADNEETKKFKQSKEKADRWATPYHNSSQKAMEPVYIDNEPKTGFRMVTNVSRYSTSNVVWRIMHPEGFEFEITSDNLCDLLETNTIIEGEFQDALFFTHNKKLVNEKTKLFADLIAREEHKKEQKKNVQEVEVGNIITFPLEQTNNSSGINSPQSVTVVYCGKYHAISISKNNCSEFTSKSSLKYVVKNVDDNRYYALSKLPDFNIGMSVEIDRGAVISEMNEQIRNTNEYTGLSYHNINYIPNSLSIMFLNEKPYKFEDVHVEYHEVPFSTINYLESNKIYRINENYKMINYRFEYTQQAYNGPRIEYSHHNGRDPNTSYYSYYNNINFTLVGVSGRRISGYEENGSPKTNSQHYSSYRGDDTTFTIPQNIEVGYYTL